MTTEKQWAGTTYGTSRMHRWLIAILRVIDVRVVYVFSYIFVVPVCYIVRGKGRSAIYHFMRERMHYGVLRSLWMVFVNHCRFAEVVIDRFAMYAGKRLPMQCDGYEHFERLASSEKGFVMLSSHVGNYELAGYTLVSANKSMYALVFSGEKDSVMANRSRMFSHTNIHMIGLKEDMSHLFELYQVLRDGHIVSMPADRVFGSKKHVTEQLFGSEAHLPEGPFKVATLCEMEVLTVYVMKTGWRGYTVYIEHLEYDGSSRDKGMHELSHLFATSLESMVSRHPAQWYNYFEFWQQ